MTEPDNRADLFAVHLSRMRRLIHAEAAGDVRIGPVTESVKWGQPSFAAKTGTPLRIGVAKSGRPAIFVHCQTRVIAEVRGVMPDAFHYEGTRAAVLHDGTDTAAVRWLIRSALTYRLRQGRR